MTPHVYITCSSDRARVAHDFLELDIPYLLFGGNLFDGRIIQRMTLSSNGRSVVFHAGCALIPRAVVERIIARSLPLQTDEELRRNALEVFAPVVTLPYDGSV